MTSSSRPERLSRKKLYANQVTPEEIIREILDDIEDDIFVPSKAVLLYWTEKPDGNSDVRRKCANVSWAEEIAILELAKLGVLQEWLE